MTTAPRIDPALSRAELKQLQPLGHHLSLWAEASQRLLDRLDAGRLPPTLSPWLQDWRPSTIPRAMPPGDLLSLTLRESPQGWQLAPDQADWLGDAWWRAWLHLPALRSFWATALRANHLMALLAQVPHTWCMDPQPLPPGSILPQLNLAAWSDLAGQIAQGRTFCLQTRAQTQALRAELSQETLQQAIAQALSHSGSVLTETFVGMRQLQATYAHHEQKISLHSAQILAQDSGPR